MGSDKSRTHYQGLLIEDSRVQVWDAQTTASQAGPRPGVPEPQNQTAMTLQSSGTQTASKDLRVRTQRGGFSEPNGAGFVWRNQGDTYWRGRDVPGIITHYDVLKYSDLTAPTKWYIQPHAITLQDHTVVCAYYERDDSEALPFCVSVGRRTTSGWQYTRVNETATQPTADEAEFNPALCLLPSGRILLFLWVEDLVRDEAQVRMWYSDDDGATWSLGQDSVLDVPVNINATASGYDVRRIRVAYNAGQILMMCHLRSNNAALDGRDVLRQYASSDEGNTFDSIEEWDGVNYAGGFVDVIQAGDHFLCAYIQSEPSNACKAFTIRLGNAYQPSTSVVHDVVHNEFAFGDYGAAGPFITDGDLSLAKTPQGTVYITGRATPTSSFSTYQENNACVMFKSDDYGVTWDNIGNYRGLLTVLSGSISGVWYNQNRPDTCPRALAMTHTQGRMAVLHNWRANPGVSGSIDEPSLAVSYLGGSSTVTMPGYQRFQNIRQRVNFDDTYLPFDLPTAVSTNWGSGWTKAGGGTDALTAGYLKLGTGAASAVNYTTATLPVADTIAQGVICHFSMSIEQGGSAGADDVAVALTLDDGGSNGYALTIRLENNAIHFIDAAGPTTIGTVSIDVAVGVDVMVGFKSGKFASWVRQRDDSPDRSWTVGPTSATLANTGGGGSSAIVWGHIATSASISRWHTFQMVTGAWTGLQIAEGQTNPNDLMQAPFSLTGTYVDDGVTIKATDGPTIRADEWKIATRYDYSIANVLDPNPRKTWRSTANTAQAISFKLSDLANVAMESDLMAVALYNCNFPYAQLHGYNSSTSSWVTLANIEMFKNMVALPFARAGDTVKSSGAPSVFPAPLLYAGEMEGALWTFGASSGHRIKSHLTGKWDNTNTKPCSLVLEDIDGTEAASGNGQISSKNAVLLLHLQGSDYQAFRVTFFAPGGGVPAMADGYFECGRIIVGPVVVHGDRTSWGRVMETNSGTEMQEARDRTIKTRKIAPTRRIIEYGWTDAVDTTSGINPVGDADPDFVMPNTAGSSEAVALKDVTPFDFEGVFHLLSGSNKQVVYLPRIEKQALTTNQTLNRRQQHALCRITSPVRLESVQGEENDTEVIRVATVTFTEDV